MSDWSDLFEVENGLSFDGVTGLIPLASDPTITLAGVNIPKSTLGIRRDPAGLWQKVGDGDFDWLLLSDAAASIFPELFINVLRKNQLDTVKVPLSTSAKLPVLLRNGSTITVPIEV